MNTVPAKPTWYILGAGAIGSLWACYWRRAGFPVVLITRSETPRSPLQLRNNDTVQVAVEQISADQLQTSDHRIQYLLISTKAQDTAAAVRAIATRIDPSATVLTLQNGMAARQLPEILPTQRLITGITSDGVYRPEPNTVVHAGIGTTYIDADQSFLERLPTEFLAIETCDDIETRRWKKLAVNCAVNGLTALYRCRNGALLNNPEARQRLHALCEEITSILQQLGKGDLVEDLEADITRTLRDTADNYSSTCQDIINGRTTEIDCLNGYLVEQAQRHGIPSPENRSIVEAVKRLNTD